MYKAAGINAVEQHVTKANVCAQRSGDDLIRDQQERADNSQTAGLLFGRIRYVGLFDTFKRI
jgi:hypothetical protein